MLRIPLLAGRDLTEADGAKSAAVLLISASMAKYFWPGENPIGKASSNGEQRLAWWATCANTA